MSGAKVLGVDHVTVATRDLDSTVAWYTEALGFEVVSRQVTQTEASRMRSAVLVSGDARVVLVEGGDPNAQVQRFIDQRGEGVTHVAYEVEDLDAALAAVEAAGGAKPLPVVEDQGLRQVFLERDAVTGVRVELIERTGGDFTERSVLALYRILEDRGLD